MNPRNQESAVKYNQELIDLILNTESLAPLLTNATRIIDTLNKNNELNVITEELTKNENYATLKQVTIISDYFNQVEKCVVMHFIDHVFKDSKEISTLQKIFCAIWIMQTLYQTNRDLYKIFSQFTENKIPPFTVVYGPKADKKQIKLLISFYLIL